MSGCSKLRKDACISATKCKWIVGKGCRVDRNDNSTNPKPKSTTPPKPLSPKPMSPKPKVVDNTKIKIFSDAAIRKVIKTNHPSIRVSATMIEASDKFLYQCALNLLRGDKEVLDEKDIENNFRNDRLVMSSMPFIREGKNAMEDGNCVFYTSNFISKIEKMFGKKLTPNGALFLAGGLKFLMAELSNVIKSFIKQFGNDTAKLKKADMDGWFVLYDPFTRNTYP